MSVGDVSDLLRKDPEGTKRWMKEAIAKAGAQKPEAKAAASVAGPDGERAGEGVSEAAGEKKIPSFAAKLEQEFCAGADAAREAGGAAHDHDEDRDPADFPIWCFLRLCAIWLRLFQNQ
jgi:hypothetical protein